MVNSLSLTISCFRLRGWMGGPPGFESLPRDFLSSCRSFVYSSQVRPWPLSSAFTSNSVFANTIIRHCIYWATDVVKWHCRRKVAGSIPDEIIWFFTWPNPSSRTMSLVSTQPLTEMSTTNLHGEQRRPVRKADNLTAVCGPIVCKIWEPRRLTTLWAFTACSQE
jgi:hypothetical protein